LVCATAGAWPLSGSPLRKAIDLRELKIFLGAQLDRLGRSDTAAACGVGVAAGLAADCGAGLTAGWPLLFSSAASDPLRARRAASVAPGSSMITSGVMPFAWIERPWACSKPRGEL